MPEAYTVSSDGTVLLSVHVQPAARRPGVVGRHGDAVKLRVAAPAEGGRANQAVCDLVASSLGAHPRDITIVSGTTSRQKRLALHNIPPARVSAWIATLPTP
jgi:uncharacterized protein (TIGR00251 family)